MNYSRPSLTRREWCGLLATLCAPGMEASATQALWNMLPAFQHFPDYLFTPETAQAVAMGPRRLATPAFDEISNALNAYRKTFVHEPRRAIAPPPEPARKSPTQVELEAVAASVAEALRVIAEAVGAANRPDGQPPEPLRDVSFSGQALGEQRRARFADLLQRRMIRLDEIPEAYRPSKSP